MQVQSLLDKNVSFQVQQQAQHNSTTAQRHHKFKFYHILRVCLIFRTHILVIRVFFRIFPLISTY